jgi:hypothetical protein
MPELEFSKDLTSAFEQKIAGLQNEKDHESKNS